MFHFLLVLFLFFPDGHIAQVKKPEATIDACQTEASVVIDKAKTAGVGIVGTCVEPKDFVGDA